MKIAIPVENGKLCSHFGHAPQFAFVNVEDGKVASTSLETPPPHEPGVLPRWLNDNGVTHLLCGGIGGGAVNILQDAGIKVIAGLQPVDPAELVEAFLAGKVQGVTGATCGGHGEGHGHGHGHGHGCGGTCGH